MRDLSLPGTWRFVKSLLAGGVATLIDLSVLTILVEALHFSPAQANIPALLTGAITQFVASRGFVFRAARGALRPQVLGFAAVELGAFTLNAAGFQLAVTRTPIPYPIARMLCQFLVYLGFSYPLWKRVFAVKSEGASLLPGATGSESG